MTSKSWFDNENKDVRIKENEEFVERLGLNSEFTLICFCSYILVYENHKTKPEKSEGAFHYQLFPVKLS